MFELFSGLDRVFDTLSHAFDDRPVPAARRTRPYLALFVVAVVLVPCCVLLLWEGSPWVFAVWALLCLVVCAGLLAVWTS